MKQNSTSRADIRLLTWMSWKRKKRRSLAVSRAIRLPTQTCLSLHLRDSVQLNRKLMSVCLYWCMHCFVVCVEGGGGAWACVCVCELEFNSLHYVQARGKCLCTSLAWTINIHNFKKSTRKKIIIMPHIVNMFNKKSDQAQTT